MENVLEIWLNTQLVINKNMGIMCDKILLKICFVVLILFDIGQEMIKAQEKIKLNPWICKAIDSNCVDECCFLKDFIDYGKVNIDTIRLHDMNYYKSFVSQDIPSEYFDSTNFSFRIIEKLINYYGECLIGEFKFKNYYGIDQGSIYIMINKYHCDVYVFYFENMIIENGSYIKLFFNTRGKISQRNIFYSKKNASFLLDCNSIR
jgi:hypothetical protein